MKTRLEITGRSVVVDCQGYCHIIEVRDSGKIILHGHRQWLAEAAMRAMRGEHESPTCFVLLEQWNNAFTWGTAWSDTDILMRNMFFREAFLFAAEKGVTRRDQRRRKHWVGT